MVDSILDANYPNVIFGIYIYDSCIDVRKVINLVSYDSIHGNAYFVRPKINENYIERFSYNLGTSQSCRHSFVNAIT